MAITNISQIGRDQLPDSALRLLADLTKIY